MRLSAYLFCNCYDWGAIPLLAHPLHRQKRQDRSFRFSALSHFLWTAEFTRTRLVPRK